MTMLPYLQWSYLAAAVFLAGIAAGQTVNGIRCGLQGMTAIVVVGSWGGWDKPFCAQVTDERTGAPRSPREKPDEVRL